MERGKFCCLFFLALKFKGPGAERGVCGRGMCCAESGRARGGKEGRLRVSVVSSSSCCGLCEGDAALSLILTLRASDVYSARRRNIGELVSPLEGRLILSSRF